MRLILDIDGHKYATNNISRAGQKLSLALKARKYFKKAFLKIKYAKDEGNIGYYDNKTKLMQAYRAFTDPNLIRYLKIGGEK